MLPGETKVHAAIRDKQTGAKILPIQVLAHFEGDACRTNRKSGILVRDVKKCKQGLFKQGPKGCQSPYCLPRFIVIIKRDAIGKSPPFRMESNLVCPMGSAQ